MRILYVSQYFPPEMGAPAARVYELAREWVGLGHEVTVLTGFPNHPTGVIPPEYKGQLVRREEVEGIRVVRTPIYAAANRGVVRRAAAYASYAVSAATAGHVLTERPDVLIATSPQFLTAISGFWLSKLKRVPWVFEVRDIWPRSIVEVGAMSADSPVIRALERIEVFLYGQAHRIVVVTDSFVEELAGRGIPRAKLRVVKNGVDLELFRPMSRDNEVRAELGLRPQDFMCLYVGTHGMAHGLKTILEAANLLRGHPNVRFVFVGEGADKESLKSEAQRLGLTAVTFVDKQPRGKIPLYLAASDLSLVLLKGKPLFTTVLPSKIFEIMGSGRPIALGVDGEARRVVVDDAKAGVFVTPENADALARCILDLVADPAAREDLGRNGRAHVEQHFSRSMLARKYLSVLEEVIGA